jgi:hypothetical protein
MPSHPQFRPSFPRLLLAATAALTAALGGMQQVAAQAFTVSGRVTDASTGEYILGANVVDLAQGRGVSTNLYGFFSITLPAGATELQCSFVGYDATVKRFDGQTDAT